MMARSVYPVVLNHDGFGVGHAHHHRVTTNATQVGEFGSMHDLIRDPNSRVHQLAQTQGIAIPDE